MLRATTLPGHLPASTLGILALVFLALKAFKDRAMSPLKAGRRKAQVRHEVPFMASKALGEGHSGSHPKL
jgi:hypothetical protein